MFFMMNWQTCLAYWGGSVDDCIYMFEMGQLFDFTEVSSNCIAVACIGIYENISFTGSFKQKYYSDFVWIDCKLALL